MIGIVVTAQGVAQIEQRLGRLAALDGQLTPLMDEIAQALLASTQRRFEDEAGPDGTAWAQTKRGGSILRDQGHLYQSLTPEADGHSAAVGSNLVYARIHQLGGEAGRGLSVSLPARPFLGLDSEDKAEISALVRDYMLGLIR
jgi:phage virion morphogenesis protein